VTDSLIKISKLINIFIIVAYASTVGEFIRHSFLSLQISKLSPAQNHYANTN